MNLLKYYYCNSALIIYITTIYLFYVKKHIKDKQSIFFEILLWASAISCLFDILSEEAILHISDRPIWYLYFTVYTYYFLQNSLTFLSSLYILTLIEKLKQITIKEKLILYTPIILTILTIAFNPLTGMLFYVGQDGKYYHGPGLWLLFVYAGYYLLLNLIYSFYYRKFISRYIRFTLLFFSALVILFIHLELMLEHLLLRNFGISLAELLLFITIQNSEEALIDANGLYIKEALMTRAQLGIKNKRTFSICLIKLEDKALIHYTFGLNYWFAIISEVSSYLNSFGRIHTSYYLQDGLFAVMTSYGLSQIEKNRLLNNIAIKFEYSNWNILNTKLKLSAQLLELAYPKDIADINDILYHIDYYSKNMISAKHLIITPDDLSIKLKKYNTELKKHLWEIIVTGDYELYYMPVYSVAENRITALEPLLRIAMEPPIYVSPEMLDEVTEDYNRLKQIYNHIFEEICVYMKNQTAPEDSTKYMNINLSAVQIMQEHLIHQYEAIIKMHDVDYHRFCIEISEATVSYPQPTILQNILAMKSYGISFTLDQFGAGYTNLDYFKYVPFDYVKLDEAIVKACFDNEKGQTVMKSTIAMMKQLKVKLVAEGVETKEQADILSSLGVDFLEGTYFFSLCDGNI